MFTGIVEEVGRIAAVTAPGGRPGSLTVDADRVLDGTEVGDSIAIAGVCQTVVTLDEGRFTVDVMPETLSRTTLGDMRAGSRVNLERALLVGGRLGGHLVNGHVDGVGTVRSRTNEGNAVVFEVTVDVDLSKYVVEKGSVTLDGVSLTVVRSRSGAFAVSTIPHTLEVTTLGDAGVGRRLNVEVDILAKYVESLMRGGSGGLERSLIEGGFFVPGEI